MHGVDLHPRLNTSFQRAYLKHWLNLTKRVILVGKSLWSHFKSIVGTDHTFRVVENGFRLWGGDEAAPGNWANPIKLVSVSNLHEGKGIDITLAALASLKRRTVENWHYKIVGDGAERPSLQQLVLSLGLADKVQFVGRCQQKEVARHLTGCDVFVLPSYREAFGISYLEAMAVGLLAIGVKGQGPEAFIKNEENGFLIEPHSVESLTDCLERVLTERSKMRSLARAGQVHVHNNYSLRNHGLRLSSVYQEAIDSRL